MKRFVVWTLGVIALVLVGLVGFGLKDRLVEQILIWRLESKDPEVREEAVRQLGEMGSIRGVDRLMEMLVGAETLDSHSAEPERVCAEF